MTNQELQRVAARRRSIIRHCEEMTHNASKTCRYHGISGSAYYLCMHCCDEFGPEGLIERHRGPHHSPNATSPGVVGEAVVGEAGLEPAHPFEYRHLKPARLPFRHSP
jgi:hypothetical protein